MKKHAKHAHHKKTADKRIRVKVNNLPYGMQKTEEVPASEARWPQSSGANTYTPMGTGQPDQDPAADIDNPQGVQSGRGPLNEEGEGERQNDQLAELEQIEPKL